MRFAHWLRFPMAPDQLRFSLSYASSQPIRRRPAMAHLVIKEHVSTPSS
jgi:hypothetical protein